MNWQERFIFACIGLSTAGILVCAAGVAWLALRLP
jgi:hypothetical protein